MTSERLSTWALARCDNTRVRRALLLAFAVSIGMSCSSGPSAAVRDKRVCASYETFWDTDYGGGPASAALLAAKAKLVEAIRHAHDAKLAAAAQAVIDGELSLPRVRPDQSLATAMASLPNETQRKVNAVEPNDHYVQSRCDALGRHINA